MSPKSEMKIVTIVGARPQFVKAGAVCRAAQALRRRGPSGRIQEIWVHTGQHYDYLMDRVFFEELRLPKPHYHLGVGSGSHGKQTGAMLEGIEAVLKKEKPQGAVVYGDTNSTLAGALAAAKLHIPVAHVEAGLRSYQHTMPEEINRLLTDHISTFLFCPTAQAVSNLSKEGIESGKGKVVMKVGDVMYDSILYYSELAEKKSTILKDLGLISNAECGVRNAECDVGSAEGGMRSAESEVKSKKWKRRTTPNSEHYDSFSGIPQSGIRIPNYYLATLHRAENTDNPDRLGSILTALCEIGKEMPIILPLHPRTKKMIGSYGIRPEGKGIKLIDPLPYLDMIALSKRARLILTDSGGVQKEAYWLKVPCITLREETEWVETVKTGWNVLVGSDVKRIVEAVHYWKSKKPPRTGGGLFGDGKASEKIVKILMDHFE
jgi:UDP-GlcNAc3NAcA epimerase